MITQELQKTNKQCKCYLGNNNNKATKPTQKNSQKKSNLQIYNLAMTSHV